MTVSVDFNQVVYNYFLRKRSEDRRERQIGIYYGSELGSECLRQAYLRYIYPDKEHTQFTLGTFQMGDLVQEWIADVLEQYFDAQKIKTKIEKKVPPYKNTLFEIHGRADFVVNERLVVEFKTCSPNAFKYGDLPYLHHRKQTNFYLNRLKIKDGCILYIDKYALRLEPRWITYDRALYEESVYQVKQLHLALTEKQVPARCSLDPNKYPCQYCDRRMECSQL